VNLGYSAAQSVEDWYACVALSLQSQESVFLIGMMAVGKTTIGKLLADALGYTFYDTDDVIRERSGADIPWIFDVEGEDGFRNREQNVIDELTRLPSIVLATGGGAVLREANRRALSMRGRVVYLIADVDTIVTRASHNNNRPMLEGHDLGARVTQLVADRHPLYSQVADIRVESTACRAQETVLTLTKKLREAQ